MAKLRETKGAARGIGRMGGFVLAIPAYLKSISDFRIVIAIPIPIKNRSGKNGDRFSF